MKKETVKELLEKLQYTDQLSCAASRLGTFYAEKADAAKEAMQEIALAEAEAEDEDAAMEARLEIECKWKKDYFWGIDKGTEKESRELAERFKALAKEIEKECKEFVERNGNDEEDEDEEGEDFDITDLYQEFSDMFYADKLGDTTWRWESEIAKQIKETCSDKFEIEETWRGDIGFLGRDY